jgi:hypothetical protein
MDEKEINVIMGKQVWKTIGEYYNDKMWIRGYPYYQITKVNDVYYLWELDKDNPDSMKYNLLKKSTDFSPLYDEGLELHHVLDIIK